MLSLFLGYPDVPSRRRILCALGGAGLTPAEVHADGAALLRAVRRRGGGLVLCAPRLRDMTAGQLQEALGREALVVVLSSGEEAMQGVVTLHFPLSPQLLAAQVGTLLWEETARQRELLLHRSPNEEALIVQAKQHLQDTRGLDETRAHRLLQQVSMRKGMRLSLVAQGILEGREENQ